MEAEPGFDFGKGLDGQIAAWARAWLRTGDEEGLAEAGGVGGGDVGAAIADEDGPGEVNAVVAGGAEEHAGGGFAVFMLAAELALAVLRMVGAVIDGGKHNALFGQPGAHPVHQLLKLRGAVESAGDAALVGDDDEPVAKLLGGAAEREDSVQETDVGRPVEKPDFMVDYAVAV